LFTAHDADPAIPLRTVVPTADVNAELPTPTNATSSRTHRPRAGQHKHQRGSREQRQPSTDRQIPDRAPHSTAERREQRKI
jgi:hypothetical protein